MGKSKKPKYYPRNSDDDLFSETEKANNAEREITCILRKEILKYKILYFDIYQDNGNQKFDILCDKYLEAKHMCDLIKKENRNI